MNKSAYREFSALGVKLDFLMHRYFSDVVQNESNLIIQMILTDYIRKGSNQNELEFER